MIRRSSHVARFVSVPNALFEHPDLSLAAKGALGYMISRHPDWQIRHDHLQRELRIGRRLLDRIMQEALASGYAQRDEEQGRDAQNRFDTYNYVIFDIPQLTGKAKHVSDLEGTAHALVPGVHSALRRPPLRKMYTGVIKTDSNKNVKNNNDADERRATLTIISDQATALAHKLFAIVGLDFNFLPPGWCGLALQVETWFSSGCSADAILTAFQRVMARRKTEGAPRTPQYFHDAVIHENAIQQSSNAAGEGTRASKAPHEQPYPENSASAAVERVRKRLADQSAPPAEGNR